MSRREFLATIAMVGAGLAKATTASVADKRVFLAGFSHETNTFYPVPTTSFRYAQGGEFRLAEWKQSGVVVVPGVSAYPSGGGTIAEPACREAMGKVLASLRTAMPVDAVFLACTAQCMPRV